MHIRFIFAYNYAMGRWSEEQKAAYQAMQTRYVYMSFMLRDGWHISFLEPDLKTPIKRKLTFASADKVREVWEKHCEDKDQGELERSIGNGRGGFYIKLTIEQYLKLR